MATAGSDPVIEDVTGQREKHKEHGGTVCIYSPYLNKFKTRQEGRRVSSKVAVEDPTAWEILEVCKRLFPQGCVEGENKGYSRDYEAQWPPMRGRIRVRLFDAEGKPTNSEITTRKELFRRVCELIPKMASREAGYVAQAQATMGAAEAKIAGSVKKAGGTNKKKKGSKK